MPLSKCPPRNPCGTSEPSSEQYDGCGVVEGGRSGGGLEVAGEAAIAAQTGAGSLDHPATRSPTYSMAARAACLGRAHALAVQAKPQVYADTAALGLAPRPTRSRSAMTSAKFMSAHMPPFRRRADRR